MKDSAMYSTSLIWHARTNSYRDGEHAIGLPLCTKSKQSSPMQSWSHLHQHQSLHNLDQLTVLIVKA